MPRLLLAVCNTQELRFRVNCQQLPSGLSSGIKNRTVQYPGALYLHLWHIPEL